MNRIFGLFLLATAALASGAWAQTAAQSQGKAERRDAIFLRFPEMAQRYWENSETNAASHKVRLELQPQARRAGAAGREL